MTDRELFAQAVVALEYHTQQTRSISNTNLAIEALRARLARWEKLNMNDHKEGDLSIGTVKWDASAPLVVHPHPAFQATPPQQPEQEPINYEEWNYDPMTGKPLWGEQPELGPVAWKDAPSKIYLQVCDESDCDQPFDSHIEVSWCHDKINDSDIAYIRADTAPLQREWQGLTDEEIAACIQMGESGSLDGFIKPLATYCAIEAKLKAKNG